MHEKKEIPVGVEDFKDIIDYDYYFVDKSLLLCDLMHRFGKVNLMTRPRRFGKTLNMSMIRYFFEKSEEDNSYLFKDLKIAQAGEHYLKHQGQYPVISITLKDIEASDYKTAFSMFKNLIASEFKRHKDILSSSELFEPDKNLFYEICSRKGDYATYCSALQFLSDCLYEVYGKKVIILIDEYDVPLQNAYFNGYYDKMVKLIRSVFSSVLKTNTRIAFAVLTGCLRISKESIFTGLNNLDVYSVIEPKFADSFGFTEAEVRQITDDYDLKDKFDEMKEWYDGYLFGGVEIYNPWSVLKYVQQMSDGAELAAIPYWVNTSSNSIIQELMTRSNSNTRQKLETLMNGGMLEMPLHTDITYTNMDVNKEHIWSFLLYTGYLKSMKLIKTKNNEYYFTGMIPNTEVKTIYRDTFLQWFKSVVDETDKVSFFQAVLNSDAQTFEDKMNALLIRSISYHDGLENFYHGFLTGLLEFSDRYLVESNRENGTGRSDIVITDELSKELAIVIETKATREPKALDKECRDALQQIETRQYAVNLKIKGYQKIIKYGISFCEKSCRVMLGK